MEQEKKEYFKFCPFCGADLAQRAFHFCPFCGQKLILSEVGNEPENQQVTAESRPVETVEDIVRYYDEFIREKRQLGLPEEQIRIEAGELVQTLKRRLNIHITTVAKKKFSPAVNEHPAQDSEFENYSLILKACSRRESLARRLEKRLLRSYFAIQLALDRIPGIIIYKARVDTMPALIKAFKAEKAAITVVGGQLEVNCSAAEMIPDFRELSPFLQELMQAAPANLWLGDSFYLVVEAIHKAFQCRGALAVSDQALYFVYRQTAAGPVCWTVISYYRVAATSRSRNESPAALTVRYRDTDELDAMLFDSYGDLDRLYPVLEKAINAGGYRWFIKRSCGNCGDVAREEVDTAYAGEGCLVCGKRLERRLIDKKQ